jgi:predicted transcriptional regulator of viral defense system
MSVSATQSLGRLAAKGLASRLKRGLWANLLAPDLNPYEALAHLRAPWPAYVSLYSALADYGVIEEAPQIIYGVSSAPNKRFRTPIGDFRIHHLPDRLMWGYEMRGSGAGQYLMAGREKAFLDQVYLALTPRAEVGFPHKRGSAWELDRAKLLRCSKRFRFPPLDRWLWENGFREQR